MNYVYTISLCGNITDSNDIADDQFNDDELEAPEWLNTEFLTEVLSKYENEPNLKVLDMKYSPASGKGDHYASVMFRISVEYETEKGKLSKSLIVKIMPEVEGHKKDMLSDSHIFDTEIGLYSHALPEFEKILLEIGDKTKLFVPCIYYSVEPRLVLIFEDLLPMGYKVLRDRDATVEELHCAYSKLAKWHAISMKVLNEKPEFLENYKFGLFDLPNFGKEKFVTDAMTPFLEMFDKVPELSKYKNYFEKIKGHYLQRVIDGMAEYRKNRQAGTHYVLSHGDFHLKNLMFKHNKDNGRFEDAMLLDFQISNLCSPTIDLIYSIYVLMGPEQRATDWKDLLNYYFSILIETLKRIGYKAELPTLDGFWQQIYRYKYLDFFLVSTILPMAWAIRTKSLDVPNVLQNADERSKCYLLDGYIEDMKVLLSRFENLGYFDDLK